MRSIPAPRHFGSHSTLSRTGFLTATNPGNYDTFQVLFARRILPQPSTLIGVWGPCIECNDTPLVWP